MNTLNVTLNRINRCSAPENNFFKREACTRIRNVLITIPTEIVAVAQNIFLSFLHAGSTVLKLSLKVFSVISGSATLKKWEKALPGFPQLLGSIARIVGYTLGTISTVGFGVFLSPKANFSIHCKLGLAEDQKKAIIIAAPAQIFVVDPENKKVDEITTPLKASNAFVSNSDEFQNLNSVDDKDITFQYIIPYTQSYQKTAWLPQQLKAGAETTLNAILHPKNTAKATWSGAKNLGEKAKDAILHPKNTAQDTWDLTKDMWNKVYNSALSVS